MRTIRVIGVLLILIMLSGIVSAAYTTYAHPAFKIRDGRDSNLVGTTLGNGFLIDITCTSNCTGFGTGTNTTDEDIRNVTSDFLVAGAGINLSRDDANDTLTVTNTAIGGVSNFYMYNNSVMNTTLNTNGELSTTVSYGVDDYLLKTWESPSINITSTGEGVAEVHIHLSEAAAGKGSQVYAKWFKNVSGVETLIAMSGLSAVIGTTQLAYDINQAVEIQPVNASDTFIIRLYGNITSTGGNASITIYTEGTTFSRFELPVPVVAGVAGATGETGATGATGATGVNGTDGINGSVGVPWADSYTDSTENTNLAANTVSRTHYNPWGEITINYTVSVAGSGTDVWKVEMYVDTVLVDTSGDTTNDAQYTSLNVSAAVLPDSEVYVKFIRTVGIAGGKMKDLSRSY